MTADMLCTRSAVFSPCRRYRYTLRIVWDASKPLLCFCMLNPSTADEIQNDPTVERCERRAREWAYGGLIVVNLFAFRATDPQVMLAEPDPVGPENLLHIERAAAECDIAICGWGVHGSHRSQGATVVAHLQRVIPGKVHYLRLNKDGSPAHPLYLPYRLVPMPMAVAA